MNHEWVLAYWENQIKKMWPEIICIVKIKRFSKKEIQADFILFIKLKLDGMLNCLQVKTKIKRSNKVRNKNLIKITLFCHPLLPAFVGAAWPGIHVH